MKPSELEILETHRPQDRQVTLAQLALISILIVACNVGLVAYAACSRSRSASQVNSPAAIEQLSRTTASDTRIDIAPSR